MDDERKKRIVCEMPIGGRRKKTEVEFSARLLLLTAAGLGRLFRGGNLH